jgi:hypothetical protein
VRRLVHGHVASMGSAYLRVVVLHDEATHVRSELGGIYRVHSRMLANIHDDAAKSFFTRVKPSARPGDPPAPR